MNPSDKPPRMQNLLQKYLYISPIVCAFLKPFTFLFVLLVRIVKSGLNERNVVTLPLNFLLNFGPVVAWLCIFKNAGLIPHSWRPSIHVPLMMKMDGIVFTITSFTGWLSFVAIVALSYVLYILFYQQKHTNNDAERDSYSQNQELDEFSMLSDEEVVALRKKSTDSVSRSSISSSSNFIMGQKVSENNFGEDYVLLDCLVEMSEPRQAANSQAHLITPPLLLALSWIILNADHWWGTNNISTPKDLFAWFLYVLLHLLAPIFTAIWLYVFHVPGALLTFSWCLGFQNIAGVLTHLVFPNAPPWFISLYGPDKAADYDTPGYAAGLTRVDVAMGTHLNSQGFHKSPIVFGAFPSLHSAMAVMCCFFICYHARSHYAKFFFGWLYVVVQWWATIYLDHHWRIDLLFGLLYAIVSFSVFKPRLARKQAEFVEARREGDERKGYTMGMRVFKNTKLQNWFDPL
ncbi:hypothetical protein BABINDRAFT_160234 [Babjeviella inositovora NRRL Y-12698]|uniref:Phosphatidic acid phosphatase type 2/haloperoxidase domain-containing protein n=1 Tax=Babjeviella inositovora NRRL Y-12698 TaxID=984486 RepID=A0A1E3QWY3_9ASCO|nr:uncharacterized protein BABINDRAFT_160234 [Babjeviella inositovora NRRL Y-12698]ODQ82024.1 hypothetical protein BABINDRAFT_160234 [Babjeviella inositovora NRRL Y-12698]